MQAEASWSELNEARRAIRARWATNWNLPVVPRSMRYAAARIQSGWRVLDVGASDGRFGRRLTGVDYKTLDIDPRVGADYADFDAVTDGDAFDAVACFEMIEHVTFDEARAVFAGIVRVLKPDGLLFISTPNIHHPWSYLRSATHETPFCYDELGGLAICAGLTVDEVVRCHKDAWLKGLARRFLQPLHRALGIDWAKSILMVARRPAESTRSKK